MHLQTHLSQMRKVDSDKFWMLVEEVIEPLRGLRQTSRLGREQKDATERLTMATSDLGEIRRTLDMSASPYGLSECPAIRESLSEIDMQRSHHNRVDILRDPRIEVRRGWDLPAMESIKSLPNLGHRGRSHEGTLREWHGPGQHLIQDQPGREDVGCRRFETTQTLWRHVEDRATRGDRLKHLVDGHGEPEVTDSKNPTPSRIVVEQDVPRLHVSMDEPVTDRMGMPESASDLIREVESNFENEPGRGLCK
jgi:hypothetical protein